MNKKAVSVSDYQDVINTISNYVEAVRSGKVEMLADTFLADAVTYGVVDGALLGGAGNPTVKFIETYGKSSELESHIDILDLTPVTAVARVVTEKDALGTDCCEYLTLVKTDNGWMIISKAFMQFDK